MKNMTTTFFWVIVQQVVVITQKSAVLNIHSQFMIDYIYIHNSPEGGKDNHIQNGWTMW